MIKRTSGKKRVLMFGEAVAASFRIWEAGGAQRERVPAAGGQFTPARVPRATAPYIPGGVTKTYYSNVMESDSIHSRPASGFPSSATISDSVETLLLVDDEPMVRDVEAQILRLQGFRVLEAANAAEALQFAREAAPIHLLITDLSMPGVDGLELTRQFRTLHPETPMLMVSGSLPLLCKRTQGLDQFEILEKPFACDVLVNKVRAILNAANSASRREP